MSGVRIEYGGVAVGANEHFAPAVTESADISTVKDLTIDDVSFKNYGNPCELYSVLLDGNTTSIPNDADSGIGWWSEQISGADGRFSEPITLTLTASSNFTSSGITLVFDTFTNTFANDIAVKWYDGDNLLFEKDYTPDSAFYFCSDKVESYNRVVIDFKSINMPYNRLKLKSVEYGMKITFKGDELRNCSITQELDPISSQISINTCNFTLDSKRDIDFAFQERQPVSVYFNDALRSTSFIKSFTRKSKTVWDIKAEDYIGILENVAFVGGIYTRASAGDLLDDIFTTAKAPYTVTDSLKNAMVTGYIPYTNCRDALMQVAFAIGAVVDTSDSDKVNISKISGEISQNIPLDRILQGQSFAENAKVTAVEVTSHTYSKSDEVYTAYTAEDTDIGKTVLVRFTEPLWGLDIINGTKIRSGENYALIEVYGGCELTGKKYVHNMSVHRHEYEGVTYDVAENVISVTDATLVNPSNASAVLDRCAGYYKSQNIVNLKIVEGKHRIRYGEAVYGQTVYGKVTDDKAAKVGERISCDTEYLGNIKGIILRQSFNLNGGIIIKDTKMKQGG